MGRKYMLCSVFVVLTSLISISWQEQQFSESEIDDLIKDIFTVPDQTTNPPQPSTHPIQTQTQPSHLTSPPPRVEIPTSNEQNVGTFESKLKLK